DHRDEKLGEMRRERRLEVRLQRRHRTNGLEYRPHSRLRAVAQEWHGRLLLSRQLEPGGLARLRSRHRCRYQTIVADMNRMEAGVCQCGDCSRMVMAKQEMDLAGEQHALA